jgi:8-oxo-dGTP pyrophosphatase MutT (NUDIX family)
MSERIIGASLALFTETELGRCVLAVQRTDQSIDGPEVDLNYAGYWELPGGQLEPEDTSELAGAQREFFEETGIWVPESAVVWRGLDRSLQPGGLRNAFFVAHMDQEKLQPIRTSSEAQAAQYLQVDTFCARPAKLRVVPGHVTRLEDYTYRRNGVYLRESVVHTAAA